MNRYFGQDVKDAFCSSPTEIILTEGEFWASCAIAAAFGFAVAIGLMTYMESLL